MKLSAKLKIAGLVDAHETQLLLDDVLEAKVRPSSAIELNLQVLPSEHANDAVDAAICSPGSLLPL